MPAGSPWSSVAWRFELQELEFHLDQHQRSQRGAELCDGVGVVLTAAGECGGKAAELRSIVDSFQGEFLACLHQVPSLIR